MLQPLIKNPNGTDSVEGDVLVTSPLWINENPKISEDGNFYLLELLYYSWMLTAEFDDLVNRWSRIQMVQIL